MFGFGCLLYEVLCRRLLSAGLPEGDPHAAMEYLGRVAWSGWRPQLPDSLPKELRLLISLCWHRVGSHAWWGLACIVWVGTVGRVDRPRSCACSYRFAGNRVGLRVGGGLPL